ncbi:MAG: SigE family RNA polymerase sigma factor, partial [Cellulomonadaceae bacterium]|nr:SigE family RNA polymerase sigma factor [Cellulomonadaceae bacterium]
MAAAVGPLTRTAWLLCGDAHRAEELVQQTLVKTYLAWPRAREGDPLVYARRILANARIDTW